MLPHIPVIPSWLAGVSCVLFTVMFVGSLYVIPLGKVPADKPEWLHKTMDRDHPLVIQQRFKGILLTSILTILYLWCTFAYTGAIPTDLPLVTKIHHFLALLGLSLPGNVLKLVNHAVIPLALVAILFMSPLLMLYLNNELPFQSRFSWEQNTQFLFFEWIGIRNYIVGPVAEEFIFRACMVSITAFSGASIKAMVFGLPLVFGIAHIHHGYEFFVKKGRTRQALMNAALVTVAQLGYTTLFGWFATFLFLRTSSLIAPCLCHSFCNIMGLPDVGSIEHYGPWKKWLYLALIGGMVLFGLLMQPLTQPSLYGDPDTSAYWPLTVGK
ncbi:hypothetical protein BGZ81_010166 [Podila clonocystis]|nr:hypothetical protein BGZ81_010166 [Podila clonocystis]